MKRQQALVSFGFKVERINETGKTEDISIQFSDVRTRRMFGSSEFVPITRRKLYCDRLFEDNKKSDEYYTRGESWHHFLQLYGLVGQDVYECFYGDGSSRKSLEGWVNVKGDSRNFWDQYTDPQYAGLLVLSNPPFSWKFQFIQTMLEQRRDFALILPWQTFYGKKAEHNKGVAKECPLEEYKRKWGGDYIIHKMTPEEQMFFHPKDAKKGAEEGDDIQIGTHILYWRQDKIFKQDICYLHEYENNKLIKREVKLEMNRIIRLVLKM